MNKLEIENKTAIKLKYCVITNKNIILDDITNTYPWVYIFDGHVHPVSMVKLLNDNDYDIIQINININDIYLINELRNKLGEKEKTYTKIVVYFNSTIQELYELANKTHQFSDIIRKADFICCTHEKTAKSLSKILFNKVYVINHPTKLPVRDNNNDEIFEKYKNDILSCLFREFTDERFRNDSLWRRLNLLTVSHKGDDGSLFHESEIVDILGCNTFHDGGTAYLSKGRLLQSIEAEKDSHCRHSLFSDLENKLYDLYSNNMVPDIIALIGEYTHHNYYGVDENILKLKKRTILGKDYTLFITTHERAHILNAYGMSPFEQGCPCYALTWEGGIGTFYRIDEGLKITDLGLNFWAPGFKYTLPFTLANNDVDILDRFFWDSSQAGKTMALAGFASDKVKKNNELWQHIFYKLLDDTQLYPRYKRYDKELFEMFMKLPIYNIGVTSQVFKDFAWKHQNAIFERFYNFAKENMKEGLPLLMSGGCALNCEWNSKWKDSGLFRDVFVPPCANDSGIVIGAAIDAQYYFTGNAKIDWDVYAGEEFIMDETDLRGFVIHNFDYNRIVDFLLKRNNVIAWVQGKYEIGPRALCHRSLIAAPFKNEILLKLNKIKKRENYRPIAPVCTEEDIDKYFEWKGPSPYMLYFQNVLSPELKAVTHVDGTARVQTVNPYNNQKMYQLLKVFKERTGFSVLCNTSLNFKGTGFINRMSDLLKYVYQQDVDAMVVGNKFYVRKSNFYLKKTINILKKTLKKI